MSVKQPTTPEAIQSRIVGHGDVDPAELVANPRNWRTHPPEQRAALIAELDRVGWVQSVIVNRTTGHLVDGHLRAAVAAERGVGTIPVAWVELSPEEEARVLVALDPLGSMAGTNDALLQDLLDMVDLENRALEQHLVSFMASGRRGTTDPDEVPPVPDDSAVYVKPGDVWVLGDHRIMCGDSTRPDDVARLTDREAAAFVFTDPPYGVAYQTKLSVEEAVARHRRTDGLEVANDALTPDATRALIVAALQQAPMAPGASFYVASPSGDMELHFRLALVEAGWALRQAIVWVKDVFVMGRQDYHWRHETILYGWRDGAAHYWCGDRTQDTIWNIDRPKRSQEHPTMKPVELVVRAMENSSRPGDLVYEPFSGSGTTIIAAETLGRRCYAMELEPRYVQVAIERWQAFTGREAVRG